MPTPKLPTDAEIHQVAADLGLLVDGAVPRAQRSQLARVAQTMRAYDQSRAADPDAPLFSTSHDTDAGTLVIEVRLYPRQHNDDRNRT